MSSEDMNELEALWKNMSLENKNLRQELAAAGRTIDALLGTNSYIVVDDGPGEGTFVSHPTTRLQMLLDAIEREKAERQELEVLLRKNKARLAELYAFNAKLKEELEELRAMQGHPPSSS